MKKILLIFLFIITSIISFSLDCKYPPEYKVEGGELYYHGYFEMGIYSKKKLEIENLDLKDLKILTAAVYQKYAITENEVYYNGELINGADSKTFELVGQKGIISKDKNNVYLNGEVIPGIDTATLKVKYRKLKPGPWGYGCNGVENDETYEDKNDEYEQYDFYKLILQIKEK